MITTFNNGRWVGDAHPASRFNGEPAGEAPDQIRAWFNPELDVYFTAEQAVAVGLADGFFELPESTAFRISTTLTVQQGQNVI